MSSSSSETFEALLRAFHTGLYEASQGNGGVCTGGQVQDQALWPTQCRMDTIVTIAGDEKSLGQKS